MKITLSYPYSSGPLLNKPGILFMIYCHAFENPQYTYVTTIASDHYSTVYFCSLYTSKVLRIRSLCVRDPHL